MPGTLNGSVFIQDMENINKYYPIFGTYKPYATTLDYISVDSTNAQLNGAYKYVNSADSVGYELRMDGEKEWNAYRLPLNGNPGSLPEKVTDLIRDKQYTYRIWLDEGGMRHYGDTLKFYTTCPPNNPEFRDTICMGSTYNLHGFNVTPASAGTTTHVKNLQTIWGCDSIVTLYLTAMPNYTVSTSESIFDKQSPYIYPMPEGYPWEPIAESQRSFYVSGTYAINLKTVNGCDSIINLTLSVAPTYDILVTQNSALWGDVSVNKPYFTAGERATITATAKPYYHFKQWEKDGQIVATTATHTIYVTASGTYTAIFEPDEFTVTTGVNDGNMGRIDPAGENDMAYKTDTMIVATAYTGYDFVGWSDGYQGGERRKYTVEPCDTTITALFAIHNYHVQTSVNDANMGSVTEGGNKPYKSKFEITATPAEGYEFAGWSNGVSKATNPYTYTVEPRDTAIMARFVAKKFQVTTAVEKIGDVTPGDVTPGGYMAYGSDTLIVATPRKGYQFKEWKDGFGSNPSRLYRVLAIDTTLTAVFEPVEVSINTTTVGNGSVGGAGSYHYGESVTLTTTAPTGYTFKQWQNGNTTTPLKIKINWVGDSTFTATFVPVQCEVNIVPDDYNHGTIINGRSGSYAYGTELDLEAKENDCCYEWAGWTDSKGGTYAYRQWHIKVENLDGPITYTANFKPKSFTVTTAVKDGNTTLGTVDATKTYLYGDTAIVTAYPKTGYRFKRWNGSDSDNENPRKFEVTQAITLTAEFEPIDVTLTTQATNGTVTPSTGSHKFGDEISVTASPATGYKFVGWKNGETRQNFTFNIGANDTTLEVVFVKDNFDLTVRVQDDNADYGTVSPAGTNSYAYEMPVTVSVTPNDGFKFIRWQENGKTATSFDYTMGAAAQTFTALFDTLSYRIVVQSESTAKGSTSPASGEHKYSTTFKVKAEPATGYTFDHWSNPAYPDAEFDYTTPAKKDTLIAYFRPLQYHVTTTCNDKRGTVTPPSGNYDFASTLSIKADTLPGYKFSGWKHDGSTTNPLPYKVEAKADTVFEALFTPLNYKITLTRNDEDMGTVAGGGTFPFDTEVTITARPKSGYKFVRWSDGTSDADSVRQFEVKVPRDTIIQAIFAKASFNITTDVNVAGRGGIALTPSGGKYLYRDEVEISATPNAGYKFTGFTSDGWTGTVLDNPYTYTVKAQDIKVVANFEPLQYTVSAIVNDPAMGEVSPTSRTCDFMGSVDFTVKPKTGYSFVNWDDLNSDELTRKYTLETAGNVTLNANFKANTYHITVESDDDDQGTVTGTGDVVYNTEVTITATPKDGYTFSKWQDGDKKAVRTISNYRGTTPDSVFIAYFTPKGYEVKAEKTVGKGSVSPTKQSGTYKGSVTVTATPARGYKVQSWNGDASDNELTYTYNVDEPRDTVVRVAFESIDVRVFANSANGDWGTAAVTGGNDHKFDEEVEITATAKNGYEFVGWQGVSGGASKTFTISSVTDTTFTAVFKRQSYHVTTSVDDLLHGAITPVSGNYPFDTILYIVATPKDGYDFAGWQYQPSEGTKTTISYRVLALDHDTTFQANFTPKEFTVSTAVGEGLGTVSDGGKVKFGSSITVTATPATGKSFKEWRLGNKVVSSDASFEYTLDTANNITLKAYFADQVYRIEAYAADGNGTVSGTGNYEYNTPITLVATANWGYEFASWSDGATDGYYRIYTVTGDANISATFKKKKFKVTVRSESTTKGEPTQILNQVEYEYRSTIDLGVTPTAGYEWSHWADKSGNKLNVTENFTLEVLGDTIVTAYFKPKTFHVITTSNDENMGTVTPATGDYEFGKLLTAKPEAKTGYKFLYWNDDPTLTAPTFSYQVAAVDNYTIKATFGKASYGVKPQNDGHGTTTPSAYTQYEYQSTVKIYATPAEGYEFDHWNTEETTDTVYYLVEPRDSIYKAFFRPSTYTITTKVDGGDGCGTVTQFDDKQTYGTTVKIEATSGTGYTFSHWNDNTSLTNPILNYKVAAKDTTIVAHFKPNSYKVTTVAQDGRGTVTPATGAQTFGTKIEIVAHSTVPGYTFSHWLDRGWADSIRPYTVEAKSDTTFTAVFAPKNYKVSVAVIDTCSGRGSVDGGATQAFGSTVTVTATPKDGYHFVKWHDGNTDNPREYRIEDAKDTTLRAIFMPEEYTISVATESSVKGTVSGGGKALYACDKPEVKVKATANAGYEFAYWSDGSREVEHTVTPYKWLKDTTLTAYFKPANYLIYALVKGTGGNVTMPVQQCEYLSSVQFTAEPNRGYQVKSWAGNATNSKNYPYFCTAPKKDTIYVEFEPVEVSVIADCNSTQGSTKVTPKGSTTEQSTFRFGDEVTVTAIDGPGYKFNHWENAFGTKLSGGAEKSFKITSETDTTLVAIFEIQTYQVNIAVNNDTYGSIEPKSGKYEYGDDIYIVATVKDGYEIVGWEKQPTLGTTNQVKYTVEAVSDTLFQVNLKPRMYEVTTATDGLGSITAGGSFEYNTSFKPEVTPNAGYKFKHWEITVAGNTVVKTDDPLYYTIPANNSTIKAIFEQRDYTVTVAPNSTDMGGVTGSGKYTYGNTALVTATANAGYKFSGWSDGDGSGTTRSWQVKNDTTFLAVFAENEYELTIQSSDKNKGTVDPELLNDPRKYKASISFKAIPATGYKLERWSDGSTEVNRSHTMEAKSASYTAYFVAKRYPVTITTNYDYMGSTTPVSGEYPYDTTLTIKATANPGYKFVGWEDGETSPQRDYKVTDAAKTFRALFAKDSYTLYTVAKDGLGTVTPATGLKHEYQTRVEITATPNAGYHFVRWQNGETTNPVYYDVVAKDSTYTAYFEPNLYKITTQVACSSSSSSDCGTVTAFDENQPYGSKVKITATAKEGYVFDHWNDDATQTKNPIEYTVQIKDDTTFVAHFRPLQYYITIEARTGGTVTPASGYYDYDTVLDIEASPSDGYSWSKWTDGNEQAKRRYTVESHATTFTATFTPKPYTVEGAVVADQTDRGSVNPEFQQADFGKQVTVNAIPETGYEFDGWHDGWGRNPYVYKIETAKDTVLRAKFKPLRYKVTTGVASGAGSAEATPTTADGKYDFNTTVTLEATPTAGYKFVGWSNGEGANPYTYLVDARDTTIKANFEPIGYTITAAVNDDLMGEVTPRDTVVKYRQSANLLAKANDGYHFVEWDDTKSTNPKRTYWVDTPTDTTLKAIFAANQYTLTAKPEWSSQGTVTGGGTVTFNQDVTVAVTANEGYTFSHWSDNTSQTPYTYKYTTVGNSEIIAYFTTNQYNITTKVLGGKGSISPDQAQGTYGESTKFTAVPARGYQVKEWSNGSSEIENNFRLNMPRDTVVTIEFEPITINVNVSENNDQMGSASVKGGNEHKFDSAVTIIATPTTGYKLLRWEDKNGTQVGTTAEKTFIVNSVHDTTFQAIFAPISCSVITASGGNGTVTPPSKSYPYDTTLFVQATPNEGYQFDRWRDQPSVTVDYINYTVKNLGTDTTFYAYFKPKQYYMAAVANGGLGTITMTDANGITGDGMKDYKSTVSLSVVPSAGYKVTEWRNAAGAVVAGSVTSFTYQVPLDGTTLTAYFSKETYHITVTTDNPSAAESFTGEGDYEYGATPTVSVTAKHGWIFKQWDYDATKGQTHQYTVKGSAIIKAIFEKDKFRVQASSNNYSMGDVTPRDLSYDYQSTATLTAIPVLGYRFVEWQDANGNSLGNKNPYEYYVEDAASFKAIFAEENYLVNTGVNDAALGKVTPTSGSHPYGSTISVEAKAKSKGYEFKYWMNQDSVKNGTDNPRSYTVRALPDTTFIAYFGPVNFKVEVASDDYSMGSVAISPASRDKRYPYLSSVTVTANPSKGYKFVRWSDGSTDATHDYYVDSVDVVLTAYFEKDKFQVRTAVNDIYMGVVDPSGTKFYPYLDTLLLTPTPLDSGYKFARWSDNDRQNPRKYIVEAKADTLFTAIFEKRKFTVEGLSADGSMGSVTLTPEGDGTGEYEYQSRVVLRAVPEPGYEFDDRWLGSNTKKDSVEYTVLAKDTAFTAFFRAKNYNVTIATNDDKMGYVEPGSNLYKFGTDQTFEAKSKSGYQFSHWENKHGVRVGSNATLTWNVKAQDTTLIAVFKPDRYTVKTVSAQPDWGSTSPASQQYDYLDLATIKAVPKHGYYFVGWDDGGNGSTDTVREVSVEANITYTAKFARESYTVTTGTNNGLWGSMTPSTDSYLYDSIITLVAKPVNSGYVFDHWSDGDGSRENRTFKVTDDTTITAIFAKNKFWVNVSSYNVAQGTIELPNPASAQYEYYTPVNFKAVPESGYEFDYWSDDPNQKSAERTYIVDTANVNIVAHFKKAQFRVYGKSDDSSIGKVVPQVGYYAFDSTIHLVAKPATGYKIDHWENKHGVRVAAAIDSLEYTVEAVKDTTFFAFFVKDKYMVRVRTNDANYGTVTPKTDQQYEYQSEVTMKATPNKGYQFVQWKDGHKGDSIRTYIVEAKDDTTFTAIFEPIIYTLTASAYEGKGTLSPSSGSVAYDSAVWVTATPNDGYTFDHWHDVFTGVNPRKFTIVGDTALVAYFKPKTYLVTIESEDTEKGTVDKGTSHYDYNTYITVTVTPKTGYTFNGWSDGNRDNPRQIYVPANDDSHYRATFVANKHTITALPADNTMGTVSPQSTTADFGSTTKLVATANAGYLFDHWSNNSFSATQQFTLDKDRDTILYAYFKKNFYEVMVVANEGKRGKTTGSGSYEYLSKQSISATAEAGYHFEKWHDGNNDNPREITLNKPENVTYTAIFLPNQYKVKAESADPLKGSVSGSGSFNYDSTIYVLAKPKTGYELAYWADKSGKALSSEVNFEYRVEIKEPDTTFVAHFHPLKYQVNIRPNNDTWGTLTPNSDKYDFGTLLTLDTVKTAYGYHWAGWEDGTFGPSRTYEVQAKDDTTFVGVFAPNTRYVTIDYDSDQGDVYYRAADGTEKRPASGYYNFGETHNFVAVPKTGYEVEKWSNKTNSNAEMSFLMSLDKDTAFAVTFVAKRYPVHIEVNDPTMGDVTPAVGDYEWPFDSVAKIKATAKPGYEHYGWEGLTTTANPLSYKVKNTDTTFTALFRKQTYLITVQVDDAKHGSAYTSGNYAYNSTPSFNVTENDGYQFDHWQDELGNTINDLPLTVTVSEPKTYTAIFKAKKVTVRGEASAGLGTFTGTGQKDFGTEFTIEAVPDYGYEFEMWDNNSRVAQRSVTLSAPYVADTTFRAKFKRANFTITAKANPESTGTFVGTGTYAYETDTAVTATAVHGWGFDGWEDGTSNARHTITVTENRELVAKFKRAQFTLSGKVYNEETGNLDLGIGSITGLGSYDYEKSIVIEAVPIKGYEFAGWTDSYTSTPTRTIKLTDNMEVGVKFRRQTMKVSVTYDGTQGRVTGAGAYKYQELVTLKADTIFGYDFAYWELEDGTTQTGDTYSFHIESARDIRAVFQKHKFEVKVDWKEPTYGTVDGAGEYPYLTTATIIATAKTGYVFSRWSDDAPYGSTRTYIVKKDSTFTAIFDKADRYVKLASNTAMGTTQGTGVYKYLDPVKIEAVPNYGYEFSHWSNYADGVDTVSKEQNYQFNIEKDLSLHAIFKIKQFTITVQTADGDLSGYVQEKDNATNKGSRIEIKVDYGKTITVTAGANYGYEFSHWQDNVGGSERTIIVEGDSTLTATFKKKKMTIQVQSNATMANEVLCNGKFGGGEYDYLTDITLTATPNTGYVFVGWVDKATNDTLYRSSPYNFQLEKNMTIEAAFAKDKFTITLVSDDESMGKVKGGGVYEFGSRIPIEALPEYGYEFDHWHDNQGGYQRTITVVGDATYRAYFHRKQMSVTVYSDGNGTVSPTKTTLPYGDPVKITATANYGYDFDYWEPDGSKDEIHNFTLERDTVFTAHFKKHEWNIDTECIPSDKGTIEIEGGSPQPHLNKVKLTPKPVYGYEFLQWSDGLRDDPREFVLVRDTNFKAQFQPRKFRVNVVAKEDFMGTTSGSGRYDYNTTADIGYTANYGYDFVAWLDGSGDTITKTPGTLTVSVLSDNTTFTAVFKPHEYRMQGKVATGQDTWGSIAPIDTMVQYNYAFDYRATANYGYEFDGWTDGDASPATRTVTTTQDSIFTAKFRKKQFLISLSTNDQNWGTLTGGGYNEYLSENEIKAEPRYGYVFEKWLDGKAGTVVNSDDSISNPRQIILESDTLFKAIFRKDTFEITTKADQDYMGTVSGGGRYAYGSSISLTATANYGYKFVRWDDNVTTFSRSETVNANKTYTAVFAPKAMWVDVAAQESHMGIVEGKGSYDYGTEQTVKATANYGYEFVGWRDGKNADIVSPDELLNPRTFTITCDTMFTALFKPKVWKLTAAVESNDPKHQANDMGIVRLLLPTPIDTLTGVHEHKFEAEHRTEVQIEAVPYTGYDFVKWKEDNLQGASRKFYLTDDTTYTAIFKPHAYTVDARTNDASMGTVSGGGQYNYLETAHLTAEPKLHYHLVRWSHGLQNELTVDTLVKSNISLQAIFAIDTFEIKVEVADDTKARVVRGPGEYAYGSVVTIEAESLDKDAYHFVQWNDGNTENPRRVPVTANKTYTAEFARMYNISVQPYNSQHGSASGSGWFAENHEKVIQAYPKSGYCFYQWWEGDANYVNPTEGQDNPRTITVERDTTYKAVFVPMPELSILPTPVSLTICEGDTIRLENVLHKPNYWTKWTGANIVDGKDSDSVMYATPTDSTDYVVVVGNEAKGCTLTETIHVNVVKKPTPSIVAPTVVCEGDSIDLIASGGYKYQWNTGEETQFIRAALDRDSTFWVVAWNLFGCQGDTVRHTITVNPLPETATAADRDTLCVGDSTTIRCNVLPPHAADAYTFRWQANGRWITPADTSVLELKVGPVETTTYICHVTDITTHCVKPDSITIAVNKLPDVELRTTFDPDSIFCAGDAAVLTIIPRDAHRAEDLNFEWYRDGKPVGTNAQTLIDYPESATDGISDTTYTYNVVVKSKIGDCQSISEGLQATIKVGALPHLPISVIVGTDTLDANDTVCANQSLRLYAKQIDRTLFKYRWYSQQENTEITDTDHDEYVDIVPEHTATYTLTIENMVTGCTRLVTRTIRTMPIPEIMVITSTKNGRLRNVDSLAVCMGDSVALTVLSLDSVQIDKRYNIVWYKAGSTDTLSTDSVFVVPTTEANTATYRVEVSNRLSEHVKYICSQTKEQKIIVKTTPEAFALEAVANGEILTETVNVRAGQPVTLRATTPKVEGMRYIWRDNSGIVARDTLAHDIAPMHTTTYTLEANNGACSYTAQITVNVASEAWQVGGTLAVCPGGTTRVYVAGARSSNGDKLEWSTGATTDTATISAAGNYHVYLTRRVRNGSTVSNEVTLIQFTISEAEAPAVKIANPAAVCPSDETIALNYTVTAGNPVRCSLAFDAAAKKIRFQDVQGQILSPTQVDDTKQGIIIISIPSGLDAEGKYNVDVTVWNAAGCSNTYTVPFELSKSDVNVVLLDSTTIAVSDTANVAHYQWYKNGAWIGTDNFYYHESAQDSLNGVYKVLLTMRDGTERMSCPMPLLTHTVKTVVPDTEDPTKPDTTDTTSVCNNTTLKMIYIDGDSLAGFSPTVYNYTVLLPYNTPSNKVPTAANVTVAVANKYQTYEKAQLGTDSVQIKVGSLCVPIGSGAVYTVRFVIDSAKICTLTLTALPEEEFADSLIGGGEYRIGSTVELRAVAVNGYEFSRWSDDNTDNPRTIVIESDTTFKAVFVPAEHFHYTINVATNNEKWGTVTGGGYFLGGQTIVIEATANDGYEFAYWSDGIGDNPRSVLVERDWTYTALFRDINDAIDEIGIAGSVVYVEGNFIHVEAAGETDVFVYNTIGQLLDHKEHTTKYTVRVPVAGLYLVNIGTQVVKVVVH